jgi:hypothetical protein
LTGLAATGMMIRYSYDKPPLTTYSVMLTLFLGNTKEALNIVYIDNNDDFLIFYISTLRLMKYFRLDPIKLQRCLCTVGCQGVMEVAGVYAIKGIRVKEGHPTGIKLTAKETIDANKSIADEGKQRYRESRTNSFSQQQAKNAREFFET